ncbi:uncharacterized protein LOC122056934 [Macadamia integrifolia]|uniref:uncharacterized protein LOC122056934 n=1 Tax=Macadamia integrifolia TaxID=60698 RepID=UPI001C527688|nr:uncharacterized protein LOC122056934 [Macadamia integrifolia]
MKALYWNIRGIKKAAARLALRNILRDKRPDFLCIAEPMIPSDAFRTLFFNKLGFEPDFIHNERLRGVSNLWLIWRRGVAKPVVLSSSEQQISVSVQWAQEIFILSGRKFTWTNNRRRGHVSAVLDRSFCNEAWISYFQECHQFVLQRVASDHTPILVVSEGSERPKNYPFRFQRFWADHEGYLNAVKSSWVNDIPGSPMMVMAQKLKRLKVFLRSWAKENFPNFNLEMMEAKKCMEEIQNEIDRDGINDSIYAKEADAKTRYLKALKNYEKLWAEKSRSRWKNQGDRCSKLFHISVKIRRMKNSIKSLKMVDGTLISDREQIKEFVAGFYEHFHKGTRLTNHMDLLQCIPNVLEEWDRGRLDGIPSDSEIKNAVWDLDPDSAPGPDGFPGAFYKSCWDIISSDLCNAIRWFFRTGFMPYGINNNFLVLIPKIEGALSLDKFRPLCMGNFLCKIISKILAMRLSCVLPKIISEEQGAFQKGKIIHSNISLASELANMMFASTRGGGMGLKIDIQKAFDTISWNFIFHILVSARISVLLNGGPVGYFGVEKGLRQGDPISPMLFIIAEEVLCRGLSELLANNSIKALSGPRGAIIPTHILFADDVFIFSNASIRPKDEGGLGLRRLRDINKAMLCNMVWRVKHENSLACKFLRARFLRGDGSFKKSYKPSSIWPGFRKMWDFMTTKEAWMIGNGDSINFWSDKWLGGKSILELVGLEGESSLLCKGKVSDFIENFKWKLPNVISPLLHDIFEKIRTIKIPSYPCEDMCLWSLSSDGIFNSNSAWEDIRIRNPKVPWFSLIWGKKMQPRVSIFGWRMVHDKLPTDDAIQKRGIVLVSKCSLCGMEAETSSHIFLQCSYSEEIWLFFCGCFNVQW